MPKAAVALDLEEERRLVVEAQAGNLDAMRPIFEGYAGSLYATVILPRVGNPALAEDVLRDTFSQAIEKLGTFRWTGKSIYGWLRTIAVNKAYDLHRHGKQQARLVERVAHEAAVHDVGSASPLEQLIAAEDQTRNHQRIAAAMAQLSARYRTAIELRLIDECSREECAGRMEVTTATFDVVLFRAVRALRKRFVADDE